MGAPQDPPAGPPAPTDPPEGGSGLTAEDVKRMIGEALTGAQKPASGPRATQRDQADDVAGQVRAEVQAIRDQEARDSKLKGLEDQLTELKSKVTTGTPVTPKVPDALRKISRKMWGDPT